MSCRRLCRSSSILEALSGSEFVCRALRANLSVVLTDKVGKWMSSSPVNVHSHLSQCLFQLGCGKLSYQRRLPGWAYFASLSRHPLSHTRRHPPFSDTRPSCSTRLSERWCIHCPGVPQSSTFPLRGLSQSGAAE